MIDRLLPRSADNNYRGQLPGLWLFGLLLVMKLAMGGNSIFNGRVVAGSADGLPLASFSPAGAQAVVAMFGAWGLSQVLFALLGVVALVRYRGLVPALYLMFLLEHLGRKLLFFFLPIARSGQAPGGTVNIALLLIELAGLALALWPRDGGRAPAEKPAT